MPLKANLSWTRGLGAEGDRLVASFCFNCPQLGLVYLGVTRFSVILAPFGFTWSHSFVYLIPLDFTRSLQRELSLAKGPLGLL